MKKRILTIISTITMALVLFVSPLLATNINTTAQKEQVQQTRTINASESLIDSENIFNSYEEQTLEIKDSIVTFEGNQTISLEDLCDLDEVGKDELLETREDIVIKYKYGYNNETNEVSLKVVSLTGEEEVIIDAIYGEAFINDAGEIDAYLEIEDEIILLSELQNAGMIENCGWFSSMIKKAVCRTVVAAAAVTIVAAACGAGLGATILIGAVVGVATGGITGGFESYKATGKVQVGAVFAGIGVGAAVGAATGALVGGAKKAITKVASNIKKSKLPTTQYKTSKLQHEWKHANDFGVKGNWSKSNGVKYQNAIQKHIKSSTDIFQSKYRGNSVYVYYNSKTGLGAYVDMAGNYVGGWKFTAEQIAYHVANGLKIL